MSRDAEDSSDRLKRIYLAAAEANISHLVSALQDPEHARVAARWLGRHKGLISDERAEVIRSLRRLLRARDPHTRAAAAETLGGLRAREAAQELADIAANDPVAWVRSWAVGALGGFGNEWSRFLRACLRDSDYKVRRAAAAALQAARDSTAVVDLRVAMRRELWFRRKVFREAVRTLEDDPR